MRFVVEQFNHRRLYPEKIERGREIAQAEDTCNPKSSRLQAPLDQAKAF
jgi:hypothetical protein